MDYPAPLKAENSFSFRPKASWHHGMHSGKPADGRKKGGGQGDKAGKQRRRRDRKQKASRVQGAWADEGQ